MKMALYYFFYIILTFFFTPGLSMKTCILNVTQPQDHLHGIFNQSISISCHVNTSCSKSVHDVLWYVFRTDSYNQLDINNNPVKYTLQGTDLYINWLAHTDDGVYHCAASNRHSTDSGAQDIGNGTTLTVKENHNMGQVLLLTLVVILSLYSLIILTLFICIKTGRVMLSKGRQSQVKNDSTRSVHFRAVVQELYSKRNLRRNKKNMSTEASQLNKVKNPQSHTEREDLYQNLKRA